MRDKTVLETLHAYNGLKEAKNVSFAIGTTASETKDPEAIKEVAETLKSYLGLEEAEYVAVAIDAAAHNTKDPKTVRDVANILKAYSGLKEAKDVAKNITTISITKNPEVVRETVENIEMPDKGNRKPPMKFYLN